MIGRRAFAILLAGLATLAPFSIDAYLPSFPAIAASFDVGALEVQQTLSLYLIAFATMTLFHGALADAFGRRPVILAGVALFAASAVGCALSTSLAQLLFFRVMQGLCAGAGLVVGRAMIRDMFAGPDAQRLMSTVTMIFAIAPAVAPVIGGWLQQAAGWQSVFVLLAVFAGVLLVSCYLRLPETLPPGARHAFALLPLARNYLRVFGNARYVLLVGAIALNFGGYFLYISAAPAFIYNVLELGATDFAWLFGPGIAGVALGAFVSGRLAGRLSPRATVATGYGVMSCAAGANLALCAWTAPALPWAVTPIMLYTVGMALAMPNLTLLGLDLFPHNKGLAASIQAFVHSAGTALVAGLVTPIAHGSALGLAVAMALLLLAGCCCWIIYLVVSGRHARA